MKHPHKRSQIQELVRNPKYSLLIMGPLPSDRLFPWQNLEHAKPKVGSLTIGKVKRDIRLEMGRNKKAAGRMVGMGHGPKKSGSGQKQWWRMDYHSDHGGDSYDWADNGYHFHTLTTD